MIEKKIAVLSGDGIGPEVTAQALKVLKTIEKKFGYRFSYHSADVGAIAIDHHGVPLPDSTLQICLDSDAVLFGSIGHPKYDNDPSAKVRPEQGLLALRKGLGLYANIRPVKIYPSLIGHAPLRPELLKDVDMVIYRELTGGIYFGEKGRTENDAYDHCTYSRVEVERIAKLAFQDAQRRRKKLTLVDKANVLETSRLWRAVVQDMAKNYADVTLDMMFVDNAAMQIIQYPAQFDVVLTENMFGDIISDEASVLSGSMGLLPSASIGAKTALFEPIHGSYPQAAGKNIANPMAAILSGALLLDSFQLSEAADLIRSAVNEAIKVGVVTVDLNKDKNYGCAEVGDWIVQFMEQ